MQVLDKFVDQVDEEMLATEGSVRKKIMQLQLMFDNGEIGLEEFKEKMSYLRKRLREVKEKE